MVVIGEGTYDAPPPPPPTYDSSSVVILSGPASYLTDWIPYWVRVVVITLAILLCCGCACAKGLRGDTSVH